ncbi:hypothetical protein [Natrialba taiwanensis]|uniref:DUF8186 domain-containing protein n=1 Tax=Natrialba taiwanensis DSM 12281 TaxID=1230458 RepID=M0A0L6_9EURY|nr:hypothetical protein [Natrialba taiwanensis]ELY91377.1 hypothetical protein C484_10731 [Natrialba taiwanensis DSM 12281]
MSLVLLLVVTLTLSISGAAATSTAETTANETDIFISDKPDTKAGSVPPFVLPDLEEVDEEENISVAELSQARDIFYSTTQPPYQVGPDQQTLQEYRLEQLQSIKRTESTSLWLPDSQRSNGTLVTDAHVTILGTAEGTQTRLESEAGPQDDNSSELMLVPEDGTVLTPLDYATRIPERTCTTTNETRTCLDSTLTDQEVDRTLEIGSQSWSGNSETPQQLTYSDANTIEPTTMEVEATITSTLVIQETTYIREEGDWVPTNTTDTETLEYSHTVQDEAPVVVTTNQELSIEQTIIESDDGIDRLILEFDGPETLHERRLWSTATFEESAGKIENIWGVYSQRQYESATRGRAGELSISPDQTESLATVPAPATQQETVPFPNILEKQLAAQRDRPTLDGGQNINIANPPKLTSSNSFSFASESAPLDGDINLSSVEPRGQTTLTITNAEQPIAEVRDIHGDPIPVSTQTVQERDAQLEMEILNDTHAELHLFEEGTGDALADETLSLHGAAQGQVTTDSDGTAVVERRDLYVRASFTGETDPAEEGYYSPAEAQITFQPEAFNIYQLLMSFTGAFVSIIAFVILYIPFAYMRGANK